MLDTYASCRCRPYWCGLDVVQLQFAEDAIDCIDDNLGGTIDNLHVM